MKGMGEAGGGGVGQFERNVRNFLALFSSFWKRAFGDLCLHGGSLLSEVNSSRRNGELGSKHLAGSSFHWGENWILNTSYRNWESPCFPGGARGKEPTCQCRRHRRFRFDPWVGKIPWRRAWQPTPVFLPGESPWTEDPSGLQSIASQRVRHDWSNLSDVIMISCYHIHRNSNS